MGVPVLIIGKSGSGKSTSLRNFGKDEVGVFSVLGKPFPFTPQPATVVTDDYAKIMYMLPRVKIDTIVIDDAGYLITNQFMRGHSTNGGGATKFDFYNQLADAFWRMMEFITYGLPSNKIVYVIMHEDKNDTGDVIPRVTGGKMLNEKVCIEGMCSIVLRATYDGGRYVFRVHTDGYDVSKTPIGMFDTDTIDNDLKVVTDRIREYYNLPLTAKTANEKEEGDKTA